MLDTAEYKRYFGHPPKCTIIIIKVLEGEKRNNGWKAIFKGIMTRNFLKMMKDS